jgi:hypothetical protein
MFTAASSNWEAMVVTCRITGHDKKNACQHICPGHDSKTDPVTEATCSVCNL